MYSHVVVVPTTIAPGVLPPPPPRAIQNEDDDHHGGDEDVGVHDGSVRQFVPPRNPDESWAKAGSLGPAGIDAEGPEELGDRQPGQPRAQGHAAGNE